MPDHPRSRCGDRYVAFSLALLALSTAHCSRTELDFGLDDSIDDEPPFPDAAGAGGAGGARGAAGRGGSAGRTRDAGSRDAPTRDARTSGDANIDTGVDSDSETDTDAANGLVTRYALPTQDSVPFDIALAPDGTLWFTETRADQLGRMTPEGVLTEFPLKYPAQPYGITAGPDGSMWFTEPGLSMIGRITLTGDLTEFPVPTIGAAPTAITTAGDHLWFVESAGAYIAEITTSGEVTEILATAGVQYIAGDPDGNAWFATPGEGRPVFSMTPAGVMTQFDVPMAVTLSGLAYGSDGNVWFTGDGVLGSMTRAGAAQVYHDVRTLPGNTAADLGEPGGLVAGPDGALWFFDGTLGERLARATTDGVIVDRALPAPHDDFYFLAVALDGSAWFTAPSHNTVGRIAPP